MKVRPLSQAGYSKEHPQSSEQSSKLEGPINDVMSQSQSAIGAMFESTIQHNFGGSNSLPSSPPRDVHQKKCERTLHSSEMSISESDVSNTEISCSNLYEVPTMEGNVSALNRFQIYRPESVDHFAEDSGIVDNIEQAKAEIDDYKNECESCIR